MWLSEEQRRRLWEMVDRAATEGSKWPGMTYEDGIRSVLELLDDETTIEEIENGE